MYRKILFMALICIGLQSTSQTANYTVNFDDPYKSKALYLYLSPFYIEGNRANIVASGFEVAANCDYKKNLTVFTNYRRAYIDVNHKYDKLDWSNRLEVGGIYYFSNKEKNVERYVTFYNGPDAKKTYIMKVPGTLRREDGMRLSYYNLNTPADLSNA
ncbi:MAG: hypothetical protein HYZ42_07285, partial [Bacteroidetes bacterium]|nr:hypothetical protein [Bacteroidota bacterium]